MRFLWPAALELYLGIPLLAGGYAWMLRRRARRYVRFSNLDLMTEAAGAAVRWRRHLPAGLYLLTLCAVIFALARPVAMILFPDNRTAVMLSIDVSASMHERDVVPTRLDAAKHAAREFVRALPRGAKAGLVSFSDTATLVAPPTENHELLLQAIDGLAIASSTAIGDGLLEAVHALPGRLRPPAGIPRVASSTDAEADADRLPPAAVILLSDGESNTGTDPYDAAAVAHRLRVKVYTIGLGSPDASTDPLDEDTLMGLAQTTGGEYYRVDSADKLGRAYRALGRSIVWTSQPTEISGPISVGAALLLMCTLLASSMWVDRIG